MPSSPNLRRDLVEILTPLGWFDGTLHVPAHLALSEHLLLTTQALKLTGVSLPGAPDPVRFLSLHHDAVLVVAPRLAGDDPVGSEYLSPRKVTCLLPSAILRGTLQVHISLRLSDHLALEGPWLTLRDCLLAPSGGVGGLTEPRSLHTAIIHLPKVLGVADAQQRSGGLLQSLAARVRRSDRGAPVGDGPSEYLSLSAILMLERRDEEAAFVWSLVTDVMRADLWLWHEPRFRRAQHLLSYCRFRLILLSAGYDGRLSLRALVRTIQGLAHGSPIILRLPPEDMTARLDPRVYGVSAVVPQGVGSPTERAIRAVLGLK